MDEQLDDEIKNRIREVFENLEDTSADDGWLLLREKFPEKAKRRPVFWLWLGSAAALLLLALGMLWFNYSPENKQHLAINKKQPANNSATQKTEAKKNDILQDSSAINLQNQTLADHSKKAKPVLADNAAHADEAFANNSKKSKPVLAGNNKHTDQVFVDNSRKSKPVLAGTIRHGNQALAGNKSQVDAAIRNPVDKSVKQPVASLPSNKQNIVPGDTSMNIASINPVKSKNKIALTPKTGPERKIDTNTKSPVQSMAVATAPGINMQREVTKTNRLPFSDDDNTNPKSADKSKNNDRKVRFGVYAATYFNYAKGSSNQLNLGLGFTSDINLGNNLKLSTGLSIAQNTLNYSYSSQPQVTAAPNNIATTNLFASRITLAAPPPSIKNYNASLIGLDVPLNLKYVFNPQKSDTYILAGLSSGTFVNETYNYSYNYPSLFQTADSAPVPAQSTHNSFNGFYFAKTLNFSFGTGYSLGRNRLIIEPFLKYPLEGLGSQQIRFGAGGLNLKFNLQQSKK
jgi:hypothetical protein